MTYPTIIGSFRVLAVLLALLASTTALGAPRDRTPPTTPTNFRVTAVSPTSVSFAWNSSADNSGSFFYVLSSNQTNSITFYIVAPGTTHTYTVQARTGTEVFSAHSNAVTVTTPQRNPNDHTPPSTPTNLGENDFGDAEFWLSWTESTDNFTP